MMHLPLIVILICWGTRFFIFGHFNQTGECMYKIYFGDRVALLREGEPPGAGSADPGEIKASINRFFLGGNGLTLELFHPDLLKLQGIVRSCFKVIEAGGGLVFNSEGSFLVIERNGTWDLPKGKMKPGEGFEKAALREVEEETGLKFLELKHEIMSTFHTYALGGERILKETRWFEMHYQGGDPPELQAEEGITSYRWVKPGNTGFIRANTYGSILDVLKISDVL